MPIDDCPHWTGMGLQARRRITTAAVVGALALGACTGDNGADGPSPSPTVSAETSSPTVSAETPSPSASEIDVTTVPDEITEPYIQAVLDELSAIQAEATRQAMGLDPYPETPDELPDPIKALLAEAFTALQLRSAQASVHFDADPDTPYPLLPDFEPYRFVIQGDVTLEGDCVVVFVVTDSERTVVDPPPDEERASQYVILRQHDRDLTVNPTPWQVVDAADPDDGFPLEDAIERSCS